MTITEIPVLFLYIFLVQAGCDLVLGAAVIFLYLCLVPCLVCLFKSGNIPAIKYYLVVNKDKSEDDLEQIQNGSN